MSSAAGSYGTAAIDYLGSPLVAFTEASASRITFHHGIDPNSPAAQPDGQTADTGNFAYNTALGEDAATSAVWALWYSNSGKPATNGVVAQRLFPTMGSLVKAPSASLTSHGAATSTAPDQDLPAVARSARVRRWVVHRVRDAEGECHRRLARRRSPAGAHDQGHLRDRSGLAGRRTDGRLWIFWRNGTGKLQATRTNKAATRIGAIRDVAPPRGTTVYRTAGDGSRGPLDLVSLVAGARGAMDSTRSVPGLPGRPTHLAAWAFLHRARHRRRGTASAELSSGSPNTSRQDQRPRNSSLQRLPATRRSRARR